MKRKSHHRQRIQQLVAWATQASIPGMDQTTYIELFDHVLNQQQVGGFWRLSGHKWDVVMTAVVLKALSALHFRQDDIWPLIGQNRDGGILGAIQFLKRKMIDANSPSDCGEDIWDCCQAALALSQFGEGQSALKIVHQIGRDWATLYARECDDRANRWCGPAYLAAI